MSKEGYRGQLSGRDKDWVLEVKCLTRRVPDLRASFDGSTIPDVSRLSNALNPLKAINYLRFASNVQVQQIAAQEKVLFCEGQTGCPQDCSMRTFAKAGLLRTMIEIVWYTSFSR